MPPENWRKFASRVNGAKELHKLATGLKDESKKYEVTEIPQRLDIIANLAVNVARPARTVVFLKSRPGRARTISNRILTRIIIECVFKKAPLGRDQETWGCDIMIEYQISKLLARSTVLLEPS